MHPEVQEKVREEAKRVFSNDTNYYSKFNDLVYTRAVFDETLRLFPSVVSIPKWTITETTLGKYTIPVEV